MVFGQFDLGQDCTALRGPALLQGPALLLKNISFPSVILSEAKDLN
jgi:hypothetical protein